jgi:MacB-like periplasmic core domain/FtsX-like permease family
VLPRVLASDFPRTDSIAVDAMALAVALGLTAFVALVTGLMPTRIARLLNVNRLLTDGGAAVGQSFRSPLARSRVVIITSQVAIAAMLLVGAALFTQSFVALMRVDRGFTPESVITARVFIAGTEAPAAERAAILRTLIDRLAALPNVAAVGAAERLPTDKPQGGFTAGTFRPPGFTGPVEKMVTARERVASPGYFEAVGMRIEGRGFDQTDTLQSEPIAIVNRAYATEYLKGDGLDQRVPTGPSPDRAHKGGSRVIGIVDDVRQTATETVRPEVYFCSCQRGWGPAAMQFIAIRTAGGVVPWDAVILRIVREVSPGAVVDQVRTLEAAVRSDISRPRLYAALLGGFGEHVGFTDALPTVGRNWQIPVALRPGDTKSRDAEVETVYRLVSDDYFASMGVRIVRGRGFTPQDTLSSDPVVVVNQTFAQRYLADNAIGIDVSPDLNQYRPNVRSWRIVGVVADVQHDSPVDPIRPELYATIGQLNGYPAQYLTVRTAGDPTALIPDLRAIVRTASRNASLDQVLTMTGRLTTSLARPRLYAFLFSGFSLFAVLIAVIGLFGGLSYSVAQRTREIGIRTALGATPGDIMGLVLRQGAGMALAGLVLGLGAAAAGVTYLAGLLFGVTPFDPATFVTVAIALVAVTVVACAIPARRASRVDAIEALRS